MAPVGELLPQPFLDPKSLVMPKDRDREVATMRAWLNTMPHLPRLSDEHLLLFLHSCNFALDRAQKTIDSYFTTRTNETYLFSDKDPASGDLKYVFGIAELVACPERTKEGYGVLLYRLTDFEPSHVDFLQGIKAFFAFNDVRLSEDGVIPGYVVVFDMRGITLSHLGVVTLSGIRKFMHYIQECHPCRLKAIHVINTVKWFDKVLALIKPFVKSELLQMISMHGDDRERKPCSRACPSKPLPPQGELHDAHVKLMTDKYSLWLKQEQLLRVEEKKRPAKCKNGNFTTMEGSFRSLAID
ncbi:alpha-tocopherol transfer protein-like [Thrips palmi]|uniref:Alpha-tocopherol transfer protein-like n=1 Tax=Thrips palmi TaxID=161013 RepID=A0A6P8YCW7_THRPL|nr:alpha-tocopherol transfer protein-like [Thrips palmi]